MNVKVGNIWDFITINTPIIIPTNIGWKNTGENVMGRGLAKQAAERYPDLALWYGTLCRQYWGGTPVIRHPVHPLIMFPVKPLNDNKPYYSWASRADLELIEKSTQQLATLETMDSHIYVSMVGCGNGGLDIDDVFPLLSRYLDDERFTLVLTNQDYLVVEKLL